MSGTKWATPVVTYAMPTLASQYGYGGERDENFYAVTSAQSASIVSILADISAIADIRFETASATTADIRFARTSLTPTAWAYEPSESEEAGDVWISASSSWFSKTTPGTYAYLVLMHEIGHTLGLKHGNELGGFGAMPAARNSMEYSVMTYASYVGAGTAYGYLNEATSYAQSLMMDDIAAIQSLYGANFAAQSGSTTYRWNPLTGEQSINGIAQGAPAGNHILMTVWDGGGIDTYDFSNYTTNLSVDLNPGGWTTTSRTQLAMLSGDGLHLARGNIANAMLYEGDARSLIENAKGGSGHDTLTGNAIANVLTGGSGNDTLSGNGGDDTLIGGTGADRLLGGAGYDTISYARATSAVSLNLAVRGTIGEALGDTFSSIERVIATSFADTITGTSLNDALMGMAGNDSLDGGAGDDILTGGTGADRLTGGIGYDTISYAQATSGVTLNMASRGSTGEALGDTYFAIENACGSAYADNITGTAYNNRLEGGAGNDALAGGSGNDMLIGGTGLDRLTGGLGADWFIFKSANEAGDTIVDFQKGVDTLKFEASSFSGAFTGAELNSDYFEMGSATRAHAEFIYDSASRTLMWDADGAGGEAAVVISKFASTFALSVTDIFAL